ncbi:MAG: hypothetical protein ACYS1A_07345 [Planctomycetota bacterium]|jgi:hypothetical protein
MATELTIKEQTIKLLNLLLEESTVGDYDKLVGELVNTLGNPQSNKTDATTPFGMTDADTGGAGGVHKAEPISDPE